MSSGAVIYIPSFLKICSGVKKLMDYDVGEFGGMKIDRGNRSTLRKLAPVPLCPPQIPLDKTRDRTRAAAVGSQRLTA
jgi:hypothetical protein